MACERLSETSDLVLWHKHEVGEAEMLAWLDRRWRRPPRIASVRLHPTAAPGSRETGYDRALSPRRYRHDLRRHEPARPAVTAKA
jgi:hypothetical protein